MFWTARQLSTAQVRTCLWICESQRWVWPHLVPFAVKTPLNAVLWSRALNDCMGFSFSLLSSVGKAWTNSQPSFCLSRSPSEQCCLLLVIGLALAVPWFGRLVTAEVWFDSRAYPWGFVMENVALGQVLFECFGFLPSLSAHQSAVLSFFFMLLVSEGQAGEV